MDKRLGGPLSRSEWGGEEKNSQPSPGIEPPNIDRTARSQSIFIYIGRKLLKNEKNICTSGAVLHLNMKDMHMAGKLVCRNTFLISNKSLTATLIKFLVFHCGYLIIMFHLFDSKPCYSGLVWQRFQDISIFILHLPEERDY